VLLGSIAVVGVVAMVAAAGAAWGLWSFNQLGRRDLDLSEAADNEPRNFLVIGSDSREGVDRKAKGAGVLTGKGTPAGQRSDSIAIMRVDPSKSRIDMLSIPRDLWLPIAGTGKDQRINTAFSHSTQTLVDTIETGLGIPINHYVEVDLVGFQGMVDAIGGVPMYFPNPVKDANSGLVIRQKGCTVLDGYMGLAFARSRHLQYSDGVRWHTDPTGDLGRMTRQQLLVRSALSKVKDLGLNDVGSVKGLVDAAVDSVTLDGGMGTGDILELAQRFSDFDPDNLQTHSLPVVGATTSGGASIVLLDEAAAQPILDVFRGKATATTTTSTVPPPDPGDVTVDVFNGSGQDGEGRRVSNVLAGGGFVAGAVDTAPDETAESVVRYAKGGKAMAELVAAWIGPAPTLVEDRKLAPGRVVVTLGADFAHISEPEDDAGTTAPEGESTGGAESAAGETGAGSTVAPTTTTEPGWTPGPAPAGVTCR